MASRLPQTLSAYEHGSVPEVRDPLLVHRLDELHAAFPISLAHRQLFRSLGSEFVFAKAIETSVSGPDVWLVLVRFGSVLEGRFGFTREVPLLYFPFHDLQIRQIDSIEKYLSELPRDRRSVSSSESLIWSDDRRLDEKLSNWSKPTRVLIPLPAEEILSGEGPVPYFITMLASKLTSRDLYSITGYVTGDQFFGRTSELQFLSDSIRSRAIVGVFGLRKTGKTSLLHEVIRANSVEIDTSRPIEVMIYQDLEYLPSVADDPVPDLVQDIVENLRKSLKLYDLRTLELTQLPSTASLPEVRRALDTLLEKLEGRASLTIILDEIEYLCPPNPIGDVASEPFQRVRQLFGVFRKLVQERKNFGLVLAGLSSSSIEDSELYGSPNPLFSFATPLYLGPFSLEEAGKMLTTVGKRVSLEWSDNATELAYELSGGHVLLLRELASAVLKNERHNRTTSTLVKPGHVHAATSSWREAVSSHVKEVLPHLRRYYKEEADLAILLIEEPDSFEEYAALYPANVKRLRDLGIVEEIQGAWRPSTILKFSYESEQRPTSPTQATRLQPHAHEVPLSVLASQEEGDFLEKKESLLSHGGQIPDEVITDQVIKACFGFLNWQGGTVLIGVNDSGGVVGIDRDIDKKGSIDKLLLYINDKIRDKIGKVVIGLIKITTPTVEGDDVLMRIDIAPSPSPVFAQSTVDQKRGLYVRNNNSTSLLNDEDAHEYILRHWPKG